MRTSVRAASEWAVAGLLLPLLGGACPTAITHAAGGGDVVGVTPPASVMVVALEPTAGARQLASARRTAAPTAATLTAPVDVPEILWNAYATAARGAPAGCHLPVSLLAALGQVESGSLAGRQLDTAHRVVPAVMGPVLNGHGFAAIRDSDGGRLDGNRRWDRAVGPMQFIPGTWARWGRDGDGDGSTDPQDVEDATAAAAAYLCAGGRDLATAAGLRAAILSYNHSIAYLRLVLRWKQAFEASPPELVAVPVVATASRPTGAGSTSQIALASAVTSTTSVPPPAVAESPVATPTVTAPATPPADPSACASTEPTDAPTTEPTTEPTTGPSSDPTGPTTGPTTDPTSTTSPPSAPPTGEPTCVVPDATPTPTP